ncbi:hypothetical protein PQY92_01970 [Candidatus Pelagibacter sp.]|nr:hypothetical protein [Candidatus Pelagibacter sp.]
MIFTVIFNFFLLSVLIGYSFAFNRFINPNKTDIYNLDILYGLFILIFISLFLNFFFPLKLFFYLVTIIGFLFFVEGWIKKKIKIKLYIHFLILFSLILVTYRHGDNVDSPMYHLQIIKWLQNEKIFFGLSNLEIRFGSNSLWFSLFSLLKFKINNFNSIYTFNLIPFSILFYQVFNKENKLSYTFITLTISFILLFSFLHPFLNGVILNHLHNTEVDTVGMVFFILSFYLFLKFIENASIQNLRILIICSAICFFTKLSYVAVALFPLIAIIKFYGKNLFDLLKEKLILLIILFLSLWLIKNFIISGCLIFPISSTCFNVSWSPGIEEINKYSNVVKGFARDTRDRLRYLDFNHTIYTYNWFIPWFKDYFLNTALIKISSSILLLSSILVIAFNKFNLFHDTFLKNKINYIIVCFIFFPNTYVWLQAPEIRFGWGFLICFSCYPLSILIYNFKFLNTFKVNILKYLTILFFLLLVIDNRSNFTLNNILNPYEKKIDYSNIIKIKNINGFDFYKSKNWKCYDFRSICVNSVKKKYDIKRKHGYLILKTD